MLNDTQHNSDVRQDRQREETKKQDVPPVVENLLALIDANISHFKKFVEDLIALVTGHLAQIDPSFLRVLFYLQYLYT